MDSPTVTPVLPTDMLCTLMEFLDIRSLKAASLVNHDFKYGADRLIWRSFYVCIRADAHDVVSCDSELGRIEEGCRIACTGIRPQQIRKFILTFRKFYWMNYRLAQRFERSIQEMVFPTLRLLTGLRQLELDLTGASWDGHIDSHMLNVIRGPFPFQLECFALNKPSSDEMELLSELLVSQQSITCLLLNWSGSTTSLMSCPPPRHVLDPGQWHLLKNWPITHLFAALMYPDEVSDLFGSLSQSTATLQLLWFMTPSPPVSQAFFQVVADPTAATVVSNLRYLVLEAFRGGDLRLLSLFCNLEELVLDLTPWLVSVASSVYESDFFESSKSCPHLRKVVLFFYDLQFHCVIRFYQRRGAEEGWEVMKEDIGEWEPLNRRRHWFPAMPY